VVLSGGTEFKDITFQLIEENSTDAPRAARYWAAGVFLSLGAVMMGLRMRIEWWCLLALAIGNHQNTRYFVVS
jgi:hypothetical protein